MFGALSLSIALSVAAPSTATLKLASAGASPELLASVLQVAQIAALGCLTAQQQGGKLTGTVKVSAQGARYAPGPAGELRMNVGGERVRLKMKRCSPANRSVQDFLSGDRQLVGTVYARRGQKIYLDSRARGGSDRLVVKGRILAANRMLNVDLKIRQGHSGDHDMSGHGSKDVVQVSGSIKGKGFSLKVDARSVSEFQASGARSANSMVTRVNNVLQQGGSTYRWKDVVFKSSFRNGHPSSLDSFWEASGQVTKDGAPWGRVAFVQRGRRFVLKTPKKTIRLQQFKP